MVEVCSLVKDSYGEVHHQGDQVSMLESATIGFYTCHAAH